MPETMPPPPDIPSDPINIAPIYGSIHSSSTYTPGWTAPDNEDPIKLIDNSVWHTWAREGTSAWAIIDLGASRTITGFKAWGTHFNDTSISVKNYLIFISNTGTHDSDFISVVDSYVRRPYYLYGKEWGDPLDHIVQFYDESTIAPMQGRYVKYVLLDNHGSPDAISSAELEIYGSSEEDGERDEVHIYSLAKLYATSSQAAIQADARLDSPIITPESGSLTSDVTFTYGDNIYSDALIVDIGSQVTSDANILSSETSNIFSTTFIYRSELVAELEMGMFITGLSDNNVVDSRNLLGYSTDISTSDETVVADMITGSPMDMATISPALGYQNYDWKYDWVARTYNSAQYKFEIRTGDKLSELNTAVFSEIQQGQIIPRGQVSRYHQWRCHVWASGSGDFELHQFTVKGYIDYPANPLYRSLQNNIFTEVSSIKKGAQQIYEPLDPKLWGGTYIPGDCNADGIVDAYDLDYLGNYLFSGSEAPDPLQSGDVNYTGDVNIDDYIYLMSYLYNNGPPPIWYIE